MKLTDQELKTLQELIRLVVKEELEEEFNARLKTMPTKEEFFNSMDKIMKELKDMREELTVMTGRVYDDHEARIATLEKSFRLQFVS